MTVLENVNADIKEKKEMVLKLNTEIQESETFRKSLLR